MFTRVIESLGTVHILVNAGVAIEAAHRWTPDDVLSELDVDRLRGLDEREVSERAERYGTNAIRRTQPRSGARILVDQFSSAVVLLLLAAAGVSAALGKFLEEGDGGRPTSACWSRRISSATSPR